MARYTIELRKIIDTIGEEAVLAYFTDYELSDYLTKEEIDVITSRGTWSKEKLARKILNHYFMREIGVETVALFKLRCKVAMQEIMEEKLPLIYSASIHYDPLINVNYFEDYVGSNTGKSTSSSSSTSSGLGINSDTPQGKIDKSKILAGDYASSTTGSESEANVEDESNSEGTQNYTKHVHGNSGVTATNQAMVKQYRDNIISIDKDIISDLNTLFMGIY